MIEITEEKIIELYKKGFSIDYITKLYYKNLNKGQKPVMLDGVMLFPAKTYKKDYCKTRVCEIIYNNLLHNCLAQFPRLAAYIICILGLLKCKESNLILLVKVCVFTRNR